MFKQNTFTQSGAENALFQICLTVTEPFSPIYLEEMKILSFSRTVNQVIMRVGKPKVEYKQGVPSGKCQRGKFVYLLWNVPIEIFAISFIILEV